MSQTTGARFLAQTLKGHGITHVFFVPAVTIHFLDEAKKLKIQPILCHSEKAAAYMADGYARISHRPGVCLAQSVGAANLASGLQDAYLGLSPVIALTGHRTYPQRYRNCYQEVDHTPLYMPVTKFNAVIDKAEGLPLILRQAFREATSGAPAPVHLDIPGIRGEKLDNPEMNFESAVEEQFSRYPATRPEPEPGLVKKAAQILSQARKPVIIAGGGVANSGAQKEIVELAELLSIPVATSLNAKGSIPENHTLSVGVVGSYSRWCTNQVVADADLVLFVGSHTGSQVTNEWRIPRPGTPVIQIDIDPHELGRNYPAEVGIVGDAKVTLQQLIKAIKALKPVPQTAAWLKRVYKLVNEWRKESAPLLHSDAVPIRPERICQEITDFLPSDCILVACTGHASIWTGTMVELTQPGQTYIRAAGSLGWAVPAALGAKCAAPDRPVICFTGDGGLWYHLSELETAARYGINAVIVVNNNDSLNQVAPEYEVLPGEEDLWNFSKVNFAKIAENMGCFSIRVTEPKQIRNALDKALNSGRPALVEIMSDVKAVADPPWCYKVE
jgi:acetolactate synthase I/II/III large subunit